MKDLVIAPGSLEGEGGWVQNLIGLDIRALGSSANITPNSIFEVFYFILKISVNLAFCSM